MYFDKLYQLIFFYFEFLQLFFFTSILESGQYFSPFSSARRVFLPVGSIVPYIVGATEVFIFFNYEVLFRNFSKNIYCHFEFEHDMEKMVGVQETIHIKKIIQKLKKKFLPPFHKRNGFLNFFQNLFSTFYNIYFSH